VALRELRFDVLTRIRVAAPRNINAWYLYVPNFFCYRATI
jgi:hypothetical protein